MEHPPNKTSAAAKAAQHGIEAIVAWMDAAPQPLSDWRRDAHARYRPLCNKALLFLNAENETSLEKGILCSASIPLGQAADDEEWWERTKYWQIEIQPNGICCTTYTNWATIVGASQTTSFICTDQETAEEKIAKLAQWETELATALSHPEVFVNVYAR